MFIKTFICCKFVILIINFDGTAGAGTFGEAQISTLKNQQVFLWLTNGMKLSNVSPWLLPSITKVLVDDELWPIPK